MSLIWVCTVCICHFVRHFGVRNLWTFTVVVMKYQKSNLQGEKQKKKCFLIHIFKKFILLEKLRRSDPFSTLNLFYAKYFKTKHRYRKKQQLVSDQILSIINKLQDKICIYRRNMTERLLKATLSPNQTNKICIYKCYTCFLFLLLYIC